MTSALPSLNYLFLDLNSYFASVEQQENPKLRNRPVAVVPMMTDATCAIAASYEAKLYGIKTGTKIFEAKRMCPHLICVLARHDLYVTYHHRIKAAAEKVLPINQIWSIDEFDCVLMGREREPETARALAEKMKQSIATEVGPYVTASIGLAPNSFLAKVATEMQKPDGLVILQREDLPGPLLRLKLTDLPGIGVNMARRLRRAGVETIEHLWNISPKHARKIWGNVQGERFWYWLHGYEAVPYPETFPSMLGHSRVLDPDLRAPERARLMTRRLLTKAAYRLRRKGYTVNALVFSTRLLDGRRWTDERRFPAADDVFTFLSYLDDMWRAFDRYRRTEATLIRLKKISVTLHGLRLVQDVTGDLLLAGNPEQHRQYQRFQRLAGALDELQERYQKETVWLGVVPQTLAGHVGTKIAFSRVPDREEFWN